MIAKKIKIPISECEVRKLKSGDNVLLTGTIVTGRDEIHAWLIKEDRTEVKEFLKDSAIYHCGPIVSKNDDEYSFVAAGPTTSVREEPYQAVVIEKYKIRAIIGKGGMGEKTLAGLAKTGAVYLHAIGGAAALIAKSVTKVKDVFMLNEFGVPEAMWVVQVKDFPAVVTMDSHGNSLHKQIKEDSAKIADELINIV